MDIVKYDNQSYASIWQGNFSSLKLKKSFIRLKEEY
jgi:hypothetical protein